MQQLRTLIKIVQVSKNGKDTVAELVDALFDDLDISEHELRSNESLVSLAATHPVSMKSIVLMQFSS